MNRKKIEEFYPIGEKTMAKKIFLMMKKNSMTLLGAAVLASGIFYIINSPNTFMASILSLQEQQFIAEKGWDIAYKTDNGYVDIFWAESKEIPTKIDLTISYDNNTVTIDPRNLSGQGTRTYSEPDENNIVIILTPGNIIPKESLLMLPFTGDQKDILLSEATAEKTGLSIGSLNETTNHIK